MAIRTELNVRLPNSPGALAGVCSLLADQRVNVVAMVVEGGGQLRLVVDNHVHGAAILREHHHQVAVSNTPGSLAPALRLISDAGVNIEYAYGSGSEISLMASIVLGVDDAQRAAAAAGV